MGCSLRALRPEALRVLATCLCMWIMIGRSPGAALQAPGSGWILVRSPERAVKTLYWQLFDETEVWTRVIPVGATGSKLPVTFVISATTKGKLFTVAPSYVTLLAQPDPRAYLPYDSLSFVVITEIGHHFDFVRDGTASRLNADCDSCASTAIIARLNSGVFRSLSTSRILSGNVLGLKFLLGPDDTAALAEFARQVKILN